jgi:hypothetical protein
VFSILLLLISIIPFHLQIPAFFNGDKDGILQRARMTADGKLTERYSYLQEFVDGKE